MFETIQAGNNVGGGVAKLSISPQKNESIKEIVLLTQEITNIYEDLRDETSLLSRIRTEISELESYIKSTYDKLQLMING